MTDPYKIVGDAISASISLAFGPEYSDVDPLLKWETNPSHGDLNASFAMGLAKRLNRAPRAIAEEVTAKLDLASIADRVEIAGPGFLNITLNGNFLAGVLGELAADERSGAKTATNPERVVIDYSSPNVAKEMHVGHIRSTVIGDALARVFQFLGHEVLRRNHVGDWGTQFGQLVEYVSQLGWKPGEEHEIADLNLLYQEAKAKFDSDSEFADRSRHRVVSLQSGDPDTVTLWRELVQESRHHFGQVYDILGVLLTDDDYYGESYYNDMLGPVADELIESGVAKPSQGAICVFPPGFEGQDGNPVPLIVRKNDGGYGYDTTDLAALRHRVRDLGATRLVYVTDSRQKQHFAMIFEAARMAGWLTDGIRAEHVPFGTILGEDKRPFKTRSGDTVPLRALLSEALDRAYAIVESKAPTLPEEEKRAIAHAVGIGAIKYADLSNDRIKDYVFSWDRMLSFDGNTAPYLQNAYVRVRSIQRKAQEIPLSPAEGSVRIDAAEERALAVQLFRFGQTVERVADSLQPHGLCTYLYELASGFHHFYERCPVLNAQNEETRRARLALCGMVAHTLKSGLDLLGIETVERM